MDVDLACRLRGLVRGGQTNSDLATSAELGRTGDSGYALRSSPAGTASTTTPCQKAMRPWIEVATGFGSG